MIESEEFPISEKPVPSPQRRFKVVKPAKNKWIIISLICTGFYISWFFLIRALDPNPGAAAGLVTGLIAISVLSVLLSLFMWKRVGKWTIRKIVLETLHQHKDLNDKRILSEEGEEKNNLSFSKKLVALLFGININDGILYYVEEGAYTADVSSIKYRMKTKMFDLLSACLGIGFLIAAFAQLFIEDIFVGIMAGSITILLSPILASWILPVL